MKLAALDAFPKLHTTPLALVRVENASVIVEVDDEHEERIRFILRPYQALRMTTADCFMLPPGVDFNPKMVNEIINSEWVSGLKRDLSVVDETGTFLNKSHHYLFPLQDDFLEVVAWEISIEHNIANTV